MLAMSPFCPTTLGWDYPIDLGTNNQVFDNLDFDSMFFANIDSLPNQILQEFNNDDVKQRSESPQGTSSTDNHQYDNDNNSNPVLAKKLNHNASERDRRKKINNMYSSLRTVARVLEYIPELQKEVEDLIHKKQVFVSKISALQGNAGGLFIQEDIKPKSCLTKETTSCSISANKLGDNEMVIQISTFERISLAEVLLLLEKNGFLVIDVSSFQSFGGTTFYNLHLWMEGRYNVDYEKLNDMLMSLLQKQKQMQRTNNLNYL
ncbi:Transcription factor ORG2 [Bienertia sinuspersici]